MNLAQLVKLAAAFTYRMGYKLHHRFFLKRKAKLSHAKLIVVGSFLAGGAGKTPFCAFLANLIHKVSPNSANSNRTPPRIAILCHKKAMDEAQMLRCKIPYVKVFTTANRQRKASEIDKDFDFIICDDGFEDSRIAEDLTIRLDWGKLPQDLGSIIPAGNCRSLPKDHCGKTLPVDCTGNSDSSASVKFKIAEIKNNLNKKIPDSSNPLAICAIGDPQRFKRDIEKFIGKKFPLQKFRDHYGGLEKRIGTTLRHTESPVIITEKDFSKLGCRMRKNPRIYTVTQVVEMDERSRKIIFDALNLPCKAIT